METRLSFYSGMIQEWLLKQKKINFLVSVVLIEMIFIIDVFKGLIFYGCLFFETSEIKLMSTSKQFLAFFFIASA